MILTIYLSFCPDYNIFRYIYIDMILNRSVELLKLLQYKFPLIQGYHDVVSAPLVNNILFICNPVLPWKIYIVNYKCHLVN